jgi:hypothetical protein
VKHLVLHDACRDAGALQQLSRLTGLSSLSVGLSCSANSLQARAAVAAALQHLHSLTALALLGLPLSQGLFSDSELGRTCFSGLTQLRSLQLHNTVMRVVVDPGLLTALTDLQHLDISGYCTGQAEALELLAWLQQLQQLTYLCLEGTLELDPPAPASAYAALTASSNLQHLDLSNCILQSRNSSSVANPWQQVFAPGKLLPQLTSLQLHGSEPELGVRSLQYLVRCCPVLQRLDLSTNGLVYDGHYEGDQLSVLLGLKQLTSFTARGWSRSETVDVLRQMSQLRKLDVSLRGGLVVLEPGLKGRQPLLPLTQLHQLESLTVKDGSKPKLELHSTVRV